MIVRSVKRISENVKNKVVQYVTGLIVAPKKKTCTEMAKALSISHDFLNRALNNEDLLLCIPYAFIELVKQYSIKKKGWLIIDDTLIAKIYAKLIEGIESHFDSSTRKKLHGYSVVVIAWTNGKITIPLDFEFWFSKDLVAPDVYLKKTQIAQMLIKKITKVIEIKGVILDGLYASEEMINFLNKSQIRFEMRMHSNRVIDLPGGKKVQLKKAHLLKMYKNQHSKTIYTTWKNIPLYFTAELRENKNGERSIVFIVSNWEATSNEHIKTYAMRWPIEMIFRTSKQYLGLQHCTSRSIEKQRLHIYFVFFCYTFLQQYVDGKMFKSVEDVIRQLLEIKPSRLARQIRSFTQIFGCFA